MKKTVVLAIILLVLAIALCGCQDIETTAPTTTKSSVQSVPPTDRGKFIILTLMKTCSRRYRESAVKRSGKRQNGKRPGLFL